MPKSLAAVARPQLTPPPIWTPRTRTPLDPVEEQAFLRWYGIMARAAGLDPNPDDVRHAYDWRGAWKAGARAQMGDDGRPHWPSEFKDEDHPTRIKDGRDTATGELIAPGSRGRLTPLADYLSEIARQPGPGPGIREGAEEVLKGLQGQPAGAPVGAKRFEPNTLSDAQPVHRQLDTAIEANPELFLDQPYARDVPRPGEPYTEREAEVFEEREQKRESLVPWPEQG